MTLTPGWANALRLVLVLTFVSGTGCAVSGDSPPPTLAQSPTKGGTLRLAVAGDPGTFNPLRMSTTHAARIFALLQPSLVQLDVVTGEWRPGLAESWAVSDDGLEVSFNLDRGYHWSDGEAFTADDVVTSFDIYRDEAVAYPRRSRLALVTDVVAIGMDQVRMKFIERVADPLALLTHDILPDHVVHDLSRDAVGQWSIGQHPVTLGAYRLESWQHNGRLRLERNPYYSRGDGYVDAIEIAILPDPSLRWLQLSTGELDQATSITVDQARSVGPGSTIRVTSIDGRSVAFLQYNLQDRFLADTRVRRALSAAIDREAITRGILGGYARPAATLLPPVSWAHDAALAADRYDVERARELLAEAGYVLLDGRYQIDGLALDLTMLFVSGDPVREAIAGFVVQQWRDCGIEARARPVEIASLVRVARSEDFQLMLAQFGGPVDADLRPFLRSDGRFNFGHVSIASIDRTLDVATSALDRADAISAAAEMQREIAKYQPVTPLYFPSTLVAMADRVHGATPNWLSPFAGVEGWWLSADK